MACICYVVEVLASAVQNVHNCTNVLLLCLVVCLLMICVRVFVIRPNSMHVHRYYANTCCILSDYFELAVAVSLQVLRLPY